MNTIYPITGLVLLSVILFGPQLNEIAARVYWFKNHRKEPCFEQARFLYILIRYYRMFPKEYTAIRSDRLKFYLRTYLLREYPGSEEELQMQTKMLKLWYQLKEQKTAAC